LTGKIPDKIGSLHLLETVDLSNNYLSGLIPPSMSSMTFLNHLNLSRNNLSGPIPSTNQFQTFDDPSIYDFAGLHYQPNVQRLVMKHQKSRMMRSRMKMIVKCRGVLGCLWDIDNEEVLETCLLISSS
jgi:hypothetical protein